VFTVSVRWLIAFADLEVADVPCRSSRLPRRNGPGSRATGLLAGVDPLVDGRLARSSIDWSVNRVRAPRGKAAGARRLSGLLHGVRLLFRMSVSFAVVAGRVSLSSSSRIFWSASLIFGMYFRDVVALLQLVRDGGGLLLMCWAERAGRRPITARAQLLQDLGVVRGPPPFDSPRERHPTPTRGWTTSTIGATGTAPRRLLDAVVAPTAPRRTALLMAHAPLLVEERDAVSRKRSTCAVWSPGMPSPYASATSIWNGVCPR